MLQVPSEIQVVLTQITQLHSELQSLSSRVDELEATVASNDGESGAGSGSGFGPGSRVSGQDYIGGGDGGEMMGTSGSESEQVSGSLRFKSAADSNVVVRTIDSSGADEEGSYDGEIEIGVYYK